MGDGRLFRRWAEQGHLPEVRRLIDSGRWAWLDTTAEQLHISAWPSIYTGMPPGEHGVYFTFQPEPGLQGYRRFHPGIYGKPTFWQRARAAGKRCIVLDPPYVHPESDFDGDLVYDWGSWAQYLPTGSVPAGLAGQLEQACGHYPLGLEAHKLGLDRLDPRETGTRLVEAVSAKARAIRWMLSRGAPNLVFAVFGETHVAGHYCWSPTVADGSDAAAKGPMLDVYRALDGAVADIQAAVGEDALIILVSGDAVGPNHAGWHLLPDVLARLGYFTEAGALAPVEASEAQAEQMSAPFDLVRFVRDLMPKPLRKAIANLLPTALRDQLALRVDSADIDWSGTKAYCLPTDLEGCIRINLKGREPEGIVEPGSEYEALLDDITEALEALWVSSTGRAAVCEVLRTDRCFPGGRRALLPDLIVHWSAEGPLAAVQSDRVGLIERASPDTRPGTHVGPGFMLVAGGGVEPAAGVEHGNVLDVAPTVLAALGITAPAELPGRPLGGIASKEKEDLR
jgi:predicted AlkP superfamily phosphohydrolase/phosphomutase